MCGTSPELRGLDAPATRKEIEADARQYVRKVTGIARPGVAVVGAMEAAALEVAAITEELLAGLPQRRQPPRTVPPLRRPEGPRRMGLAPPLRCARPPPPPPGRTAP